MASSISKIRVIGQAAILRESPLHPEKITVCCGLWAGGVIGPFFFHDDQDRHVTVNGNRYRSIITEYFCPELDDMDLDLDGATSHTAIATFDLLETKFGERVISRNGPVNWRLRSCDLTPLDYFLWGYVKSMVYANKLTTIDELRTNIQREIAAVSADLCLKTVENLVQSLDFCKRARGSHAKKNTADAGVGVYLIIAALTHLLSHTKSHHIA